MKIASLSCMRGHNSMATISSGHMENRISSCTLPRPSTPPPRNSFAKSAWTQSALTSSKPTPNCSTSIASRGFLDASQRFLTSSEPQLRTWRNTRSSPSKYPTPFLWTMLKNSTTIRSFATSAGRPAVSSPEKLASGISRCTGSQAVVHKNICASRDKATRRGMHTLSETPCSSFFTVRLGDSCPRNQDAASTMKGRVRLKNVCWVST
mmetsp:Transcript_3587/g.9018  ORF Transcript_3587/g.9018 Transcript_3587/m.9018 type:complete len:208 (+) Transcript_3587:1248-1871(+)